MDLYKLILGRRSIRKFEQREIPFGVLKKIVNAARLAPSAANLQFLEYVIIKDKKIRDKIFPYTKWAGYIYPSGTPKVNERPAVYIAIIINHKKSACPDLRDIGAAVENLMLASLSFGLGNCCLGAIDKKSISKILNLPKHCQLDCLVALGYPGEAPTVLDSDKNIKYWRNEKGQHFVPKRTLESILHWNVYSKRSKNIAEKG